MNSKSLYNAIVHGYGQAAAVPVPEASAAGACPVGVVPTAMIPAMEEAGRSFESEEYFVPEVFLAGRAMRGAIEILRALPATSDRRAGRLVIGTAAGSDGVVAMARTFMEGCDAH